MDVKVLSPTCRDHVSHIKTGIVAVTFRAARIGPNLYRDFVPCAWRVFGQRSEKPHGTLYSPVILAGWEPSASRKLQFRWAAKTKGSRCEKSNPLPP
jgi:hypothetical protein